MDSRRRGAAAAPGRRVAALYDIHGNLPALEAVVAEVRQAGVDTVVIGGDVFLGPMPRETIAYLRELELPTVFLSGNADRAVLDKMRGLEPESVPERARGAVTWVAGELTTEDQQWLAAWPAGVTDVLPQLGTVLFCHATPRNDTEIFTRTTPADRLLPVFAGVDASVVICGHTHMQFDRTVGSIRVVNAGSVGMSFSGVGAFWLLLGPGVELRHTAYDREDAARRIRHSSYPGADEFAARNVLTTPTEEDTLALLGRSELR